MLDFQQQLDKFFQNNSLGYARDPRTMAYKKLQKNTQGMDRGQVETFVDANLFIPHSQYKMALANLISFLRKYDEMNKLNEVKQLQKLAGLLKETWHPDDPSSIDIDDIRDEDPEDYDDMSETVGQSSTEILGDLIDNMQDDEEGLDQGLSPSELIDYDQVAKEAVRLGLRVDIKKLKQLAKANDTGFLYSGEEMVSRALPNSIKEDEGEGTDYDESSDSESDDTDAMGGINEAEPRKKGTLDQKEKIIEKLQYAIEDYLEDIGLKEISVEERPKFEKGHGYTKTAPFDVFFNKTRTHFHYMTPEDDPKRSDPRHNDQEVTYGLRIYKPNERFNISTLRGFIQQAKGEAKVEGFRFFDKLNKSNQDILCSVTVR